MLKSEELMQKIEATKDEMKQLKVENKIDEAHSKIEILNSLMDEFKKVKELENCEIEDIQISEIKGDKIEMKNTMRLIIKNMAGKKLTAEEMEIVNASMEGESYLLPVDVRTRIHELVRDQKSLKNILGNITTTGATGSIPVEDFETVEELIDFEDGNEITEANDIRFKQVKFALKQKGAILPLSNTLLAMTDNDLIDYVARVFAKKAVKTYNRMALEVLAKDKTPITGTGVKALVSAINKNIDPAVTAGACIVCNQEAYAEIVAASNGDDVAYLQNDLSKAPSLHVCNMPIHVLSAHHLPTTSGKARIYAGNLAMAAAFVEAGSYEFATSSEAGFTKNVTMARIVDKVDCIKLDNSDSVYVALDLTLATK